MCVLLFFVSFFLSVCLSLFVCLLFFLPFFLVFPFFSSSLLKFSHHPLAQSQYRKHPPTHLYPHPPIHQPTKKSAWTTGLPDEIQQGVQGRDVLGQPLAFNLGQVVGVSRMDGEHEDDADDDGNEGGGHVVDDGPQSQAPRRRLVQGGSGRDETGHDEWQDQALRKNESV